MAANDIFEACAARDLSKFRARTRIIRSLEDQGSDSGGRGATAVLINN
jgi:hypothetical protein